MNKKSKKELSSQPKSDLEKQKLILEINELQKKNKRRIFNTILIALISIPTIWFYYKEFTEPIIQRDNIKLSLENEQRAQELRQLSEIHRRELIDLENERKQREENYLVQIKENEKQQKDILKQLEQMRDEYQKLNRSYVDRNRESKEFKSKIDSLNNQIKEKEQLIEGLGENIKQKELRVKSRFRPTPLSLSANDVKSMLTRNNFFEYIMNENGHGFNNDYEIQIINGDKIINDRASGLMWQAGGSVKAMKYESTKRWIDEINNDGYAGYNDWRLPTLEEAMSLMESQKLNDNLHIENVFAKKQGWIWTSDVDKGESWQWIVSFLNGGCEVFNLEVAHYVRAVRSAQSSNE